MGYLFGPGASCKAARAWANCCRSCKRSWPPNCRHATGATWRKSCGTLPEVNEVLIDGTERPIARPQHQRRRDRHYSGRRKRTTVKNVVVTAGGRVVLLTPTRTGPAARQGRSRPGVAAPG